MGIGQIIAVTSGKGGTGKTTSSAAIASCLAAIGKKTLCLDCDAGLKNLDLALGIPELTFTDFSDVLSGHSTLEKAVVSHPDIQHLRFLSAPFSIMPEEIDPDTMLGLFDQIRREYDYCIVDCPAGIGAGFRLAVTGVDMAIVVSNCDNSSLRDCQRVVTEIRSLGVNNVRLLVNRVKKKLLKESAQTIDDVIDAVGAQLIGLISDDDAVTLAVNSSTPLILYNSKKAAVQYLRVTRRILGERIKIGKV